MEKTYIRRTGGHDVSGRIGREECLAVNQSQVAGFAWLGVLVGYARLRVRTRDLD